MKKRDRNKLEPWDMWIWRRLENIKWTQVKATEEMLSKMNAASGNSWTKMEIA